MLRMNWLLRPVAIIVAQAFLFTFVLSTWPAMAQQSASGLPKLALEQTTCTLDGVWRSSFGLLTLGHVNEPASLSGVYRARDGLGRLTGKASAGRVAFQWFDPENYRTPQPSGTGDLEVSSDCKTLTGNYRVHGEAQPIKFIARRISSSTSKLDVDLAALAGVANRFSTVGNVLSLLGNKIPLDSYDPKAVSKTLGSDPESAWRFVRQHTVPIPYRGVLRGARGVLMDHQGDSLDRALLLAELLSIKGHTVRLAHAMLSADLARRLLSLPVPKEHLAVRTFDVRAATDAALSPYPLLKQQLDKFQPQAPAKTKVNFVARINLETKEILKLLGDHRNMIGSAIGSVVKDMQDHWWVQVQQANGSWRDLELSTGDGKALVPAEETMSRNAIPQSLYHRVSLRLVAEIQDKGKTRQETLLDVHFHPSAYVGRPFTLYHAPLTFHHLYSNIQDATKEQLLNAIRDETIWVPAIDTGKQLVIQKVLNFDGTVTDYNQTVADGLAKSIDDKIAAAGALEHPSANLFKQLSSKIDNPGGSSRRAGPIFPGDRGAGAKVTAEWLDITLSAPGRKPRLYRRIIFDLIGRVVRSQGPGVVKIDDAARMRRGLALFSSVSFMVTADTPDTDYLGANLSKRLGQWFDEAGDELGRQATGGGKPRLPELPKVALPLQLFLMSRWRFSNPAQMPEADRANLFALWQGMRTGNDGKSIAEYRQFDIVENAHKRLIGRDPQAVQAAIRQGVADTVLETLAVGDKSAPGNTSVRFANDIEKGRRWTLLSSRHDSAMATLRLPNEALARISNDLDEGYWVITPSTLKAAKLAQFAYWRFDPETGSLVGTSVTGRGQAYGQYAVQLVTIIAGANALYSCWTTFISPELNNKTQQTHYFRGTALGLTCAAATLVFMGTALAAIEDLWAGKVLEEAEKDTLGWILAISGLVRLGIHHYGDE